MKVSLYQKLALSLLGVFILIVGAFILVIQILNSITRDQAEQELHHALAEHLVHDNPLLSRGQYDKEALENLFHSMMVLGPNFEFYILDNSGKILIYSAKPGEVIREKIDLRPIQSVLNGRIGYPTYADDPRSDQQKVFSAAPIIKDGNTTGYLYVIIGGQKYDTIFAAIRDNEQAQLIGILVAASLLFLLVILLLVFSFFVKPVKQLSCQVSQLSVKQLDKKLPLIKTVDNGVEVTELSMVFNELITQVNSQFEQLDSVDKERRELLAHLSHDLRTPLASLQGFLETIQLKQSHISSDELSRYIQRCLKNAVSLKGFVDQIFELAHLESGEITVTKEKFPLADLLFDMVDKFSPAAKRKGISIDVELDKEELVIHTDIAKLERILTNLIENAIRHTPLNGKVCLGAVIDEASHSVSLIIRDNGTGLDDKELPFLFDARYRGKQSVDDENRHIGLGLTITRKLVKLLGSEIKAGNNPDGGASFTIGLPIQA